MFLTGDAGLHSVFILFNLSPAFDTVDHRCLVSCLKPYVEISKVAQWGSAPSVLLTCSTVFWSPPEEYFRSLSFSVYMQALVKMIHKHNVSFHFYADNTQFYLLLKPGKINVLTIIFCFADIKIWMFSNCLMLNHSTTELILIIPVTLSINNDHNLCIDSISSLSNIPMGLIK